MIKSRRDFVKQTLTGVSAVAVPYFWSTQSAFAEDMNSKPTVAAIGVGGSRGRYSQGRAIARNASKLGKMIAVCDVDALHTAEFNAEFDGKLTEYGDYRVLLEENCPDIVTIGTPDHWHVPISIAAMRAGCDVYCEKPLTLTIEEGKVIRDVVQETGRVFQVGSQQRSRRDLFLRAIAIVKMGLLGKNVNATVAIGGSPAGGPFAEMEPPTELDWDMWLGPAPLAKYSEERRKMFRWYFEYSGGKMTDWGAHHIDIAQWALSKDDTGPVSVKGDGVLPKFIPDEFNWRAFLDGEQTLPNAYCTPGQFHLDLTFADDTRLSVHHTVDREDGTKFVNGILFEGEEGRIFVNRGKLVGKPIEELTETDNEKIEEKINELYKGKKTWGHMRNFFDCVQDREDPISDVYTHHRTMTSCHMCNIALMLGRELHWDPDAEVFVGDDQANALMSRKSRELPAMRSPV